MLALFVGGVLNIGFTSMAQAYVQLEAPPARRGRVVGLFSMSWNGMRVGSGITVGIIGAVIGVHYSLALSALAFMVFGLALLLYANGRQDLRRGLRSMEPRGWGKELPEHMKPKSKSKAKRFEGRAQEKDGVEREALTSLSEPLQAR